MPITREEKERIDALRNAYTLGYDEAMRNVYGASFKVIRAPEKAIAAFPYPKVLKTVTWEWRGETYDATPVLQNDKANGEFRVLINANLVGVRHVSHLLYSYCGNASVIELGPKLFAAIAEPFE